jgi:hypothetical protein
MSRVFFSSVLVAAGMITIATKYKYLHEDITID